MVNKYAFLILILTGTHVKAQQVRSVPMQKNTGRTYHVGFRNIWTMDKNRHYELKSDSGTIFKSDERPVLINIWYPVLEDGKKMHYQGYIDIRIKDPALKVFSDKLYEYEKNVISTQLLGKNYNELNKKEAVLLDSFFRAETSAIRDAPYTKKRKFPLIVYHSGAASSFEDNSLFCELMAKNGYVVISCPYQKGDGSTLNIDADADSFSDFEFLLDFAEKTGIANMKNISFAGHSAGAQTILKYQATGRSKAKNLVILDTTQDYVTLAMNSGYPFTKNVSDNIQTFNNNILVVAGPTAIFELYDKLIYADRTYLTIDLPDHDDFISQGIIASKMQGKESVFQENKKKYEELNHFILGYLNNETHSETFHQYDFVQVSNPSENEKPTDDAVISNARLFFRYCNQFGAEKGLELLESHKEKIDDYPVYSSTFGFAWIFDMLAKDQKQNAHKVFSFYKSLNKDKEIIHKFKFRIMISDMRSNTAMSSQLKEYLALLANQ